MKVENFKKYSRKDVDLYDAFKSFDLNGYRYILTKLLMFGTFVCPTISSSTKNSFFLRHDVELSLHNTHKLFNIERELGILSHFYFRTGSPTYDISSPKFKAIVAEIQDHGSCIGLHFERFNMSIAVEHEFKMQIELLENSINAQVVHFSPHNPGSLQNTEIPSLPDKYTNAYSVVNNLGFGYISDSNGTWKDDFLFEFFSSLGKKPYQILIHPEWWNNESLNPLSSILKVYSNNYLENLKDYAAYHKKSLKFNENEIAKFEKQINLISQSISEILE
jgi:hypothetical protein